MNVAFALTESAVSTAMIAPLTESAVSTAMIDALSKR